MNRILALVVTYNKLEMLKKCVRALLGQSICCDILIVDNASTDGTEDYICYEYSNSEVVHYKNTGANLGGAGGFNLGMRWAVENGYEYIWVMDDDCIPTNSALEKFIEVDERIDADYGFLSSKVMWKDNTVCIMNIQRKTMYKNVEDFVTDIVPVAMASFVSLFLPTSIIKEVGLPIKDFFIWTDDWEFTRRISLRYPCYLVNTSAVVHECASNIGASVVNASVDRLDRFNYLYRNDVYLYRREGISGYIYELLRLTTHCLRVLLKAPDNKLKRMFLIVSGTVRGLSFFPLVEKV